VVYGRNMADGSYFGGLNKYLDVEYLDAHREIDVYGVNAKHTYQVFAVVVYDDRRITDTYTDGELLDQWAFLQSLQTDGLPGTILLDDMGVDAGRDRLLTLSTGITDRPDNRLLIVAVER
jgi:sortase B